uniref:Cell death regulator Aven n=1 Tax=Cuerna arida TaxID=1464854 RepID=A0A1B6GCK0_9HEMI
MSSNQNSSGKKPRNQRDKKKKKENEVETPNLPKAEAVIEEKAERKQEGFAPQPQRTNRRQRPNDQTTKNTGNAIPQGNATPPIPQEKKEKIENVVVDHSYLKRETEEIEKLSKKFAKREITSNWHRYSATEDTAETRHQEEDAPADFSDLLQVPESRGGHLLLKEEQEWSAVSGSELGGYFALDLKLLGQGLACLPMYEQLRLPKHMLTEEEVKYLDSLAEQSKKCWKTDKFEDPNTKVLFMNADRSEESLEQRSTSKINTHPEVKDHLNIFNVEKSTAFNVTLESEKSLNAQISAKELTENNKPYIDTVHNEQDLKQYTVVVEETLKSPEIVELNKDKNQMICNSDIPVDTKSEKVDFYKNSVISSMSPAHINNEEGYKKLDRHVFEKSLSPEITLEKSQIIENSDKCILNEMGTENNHLNENIINQPKDKRSKKSTAREKSVETSSNNITEKLKDTLEDDDDDLDYLLSLKKPVNPQTRKELKPVAIKDTSFLPGGTAVSEAATQEKHSELDDWLDSVLED